MTVVALKKPVRVFVHIAPSGAWVIEDELQHRGGRFRSRDAAMRFIKREFGADIVLVERPWPACDVAA